MAEICKRTSWAKMTWHRKKKKKKKDKKKAISKDIKMVDSLIA